MEFNVVVYIVGAGSRRLLIGYSFVRCQLWIRRRIAVTEVLLAVTSFQPGELKAVERRRCSYVDISVVFVDLCFFFFSVSTGRLIALIVHSYKDRRRPEKTVRSLFDIMIVELSRWK